MKFIIIYLIIVERKFYDMLFIKKKYSFIQMCIEVESSSILKKK